MTQETPYIYTIDEIKNLAREDAFYALRDEHDKYKSQAVEAYALMLDVMYCTGETHMHEDRVLAFFSFVDFCSKKLSTMQVGKFGSGIFSNRISELQVVMELPRIYEFPKWSLYNLIGELAAAMYLFGQAIDSQNWFDNYGDKPCYWGRIFWIASRPDKFQIIALVVRGNLGSKYNVFVDVPIDAPDMQVALHTALAPQW